MGLETSLETGTKSQDSITAVHVIEHSLLTLYNQLQKWLHNIMLQMKYQTKSCLQIHLNKGSSKDQIQYSGKFSQPLRIWQHWQILLHFTIGDFYHGVMYLSLSHSGWWLRDGAELISMLKFRIVVRFGASFHSKFAWKSLRALCAGLEFVKIYQCSLTKKCNIKRRILDCNLQQT